MIYLTLGLFSTLVLYQIIGSWLYFRQVASWQIISTGAAIAFPWAIAAELVLVGFFLILAITILLLEEIIG